jgi:purine-nucleoside phosphorylase
LKIDLSFKYKDLIEQIKKEQPFTPDFAIILGSGLGEFASSTTIKHSISTIDLKGYPPSTIEGHSGKIVFAEAEDKNLLLFQGRIHFYEGYKIYECILPVFIAHQLNSKKLLITNAAGGINRNFSPGDLMLAISLNGINIKKELTEIIGVPSTEMKQGLADFPSTKLNSLIRKAANDEKISLQEGTYWYLKGPSYETPAEIEMMHRFGADAAGMSTVHEAIFAATLGIEVAAISCITNLAAGLSNTKISHDEVTETANRIKSKFERLLKKIISYI